MESELLQKLKITSNNDESDILKNIQKMTEILYFKVIPKMTNSLCQELLCIAQIVYISMEILKAKHYTETQINEELLRQHWNENNQLFAISRDPLEYCAIKILDAPDGERYLPEIYSVFQGMKMPNDSFLNIVQSVHRNVNKKTKIANTFAAIRSDFSTEIEAHEMAIHLLHQLECEPINRRNSIITKIVAFKDANFTFEHLMHILLVDVDDGTWCSEMSCRVYGKLIDVLSKRPPNYVPLFWQKMLTILGDQYLLELFWKCCRLKDLFELIANIIFDYLAKVQQIDDADECQWVILDINCPLRELEFSDVAKIVAVLRSIKSSVFFEFENLLQTKVIGQEILWKLIDYEFVCSL